jgi:hypothetical protein
LQHVGQDLQVLLVTERTGAGRRHLLAHVVEERLSRLSEPHLTKFDALERRRKRAVIEIRAMAGLAALCVRCFAAFGLRRRKRRADQRLRGHASRNRGRAYEKRPPSQAGERKYFPLTSPLSTFHF